MTISSIQTDGNIWCQWFDKNQELKGQSFKPTVLESNDGGPVIG
ncbi:hypothetical protein CO675_27050 [Bradyrhizobium sp. C9]|nr:hypothetical protein CO675_27050 [Bradyrhizobium sp. C9]